MPKRLIDGEALWTSAKLRQVEPEFRLHYANWIPMAEANGVFEADPRLIWYKVYALMMDGHMTPQKVKAVLDDFVRVGLVQTWEVSGKTFGYFVGMDKPGRLPTDAHKRRFKNLPPLPPDPPKLIRNVPGESGNVPGESGNVPGESGNVPGLSGNIPGLSGPGIGIGIGLGIGLGKTLSSEDDDGLKDSSQDLSAPLERIWQYYLSKAGKNPKLNTFSDHRQVKGRARLRECLKKVGGDMAKAERLMEIAIEKMVSSDFHMGRSTGSGGKKYNTWENNLFGSYEQMERWWNFGK